LAGNKDMEALFSYTAPEPPGLAETVSQGKIRPAQPLQFGDEGIFSAYK